MSLIAESSGQIACLLQTVQIIPPEVQLRVRLLMGLWFAPGKVEAVSFSLTVLLTAVGPHPPSMLPPTALPAVLVLKWRTAPVLPRTVPVCAEHPSLLSVRVAVHMREPEAVLVTLSLSVLMALLSLDQRASVEREKQRDVVWAARVRTAHAHHHLRHLRLLTVPLTVLLPRLPPMPPQPAPLAAPRAEEQQEEEEEPRSTVPASRPTARLSAPR